MQKDKQIQKYLRAIARRLNMSTDVKDRVLVDLESAIRQRMEDGQEMETIIQEMGAPAQVAAELNEQMKELTYVKSPWRWACLALAILSGAAMLFGGGIGLLTFLLNRAVNSSVGIIGGADGPTAIFVTTSPDATLYQVGICLLLLVMGLIGFFALRRCPRK